MKCLLNLPATGSFCQSRSALVGRIPNTILSNLLLSFLVITSSVAVATQISSQNPTAVPVAQDSHSASGSSAWLDEVQRDVAQREYFASNNGVGLQAPNRKQAFRSYFDRQGVRIFSRSEKNQAMGTLHLTRVGRLSAPSKIGPAEVHAENRSVTLNARQAQTIFLNAEEGLAIRWVLPTRAAGTGSTIIELEFGDAKPELKHNEVWMKSRYASLRLGALRAVDAGGTPLDIAFSLTGNRLRLAVDDTSAAYPIQFTGIVDQPWAKVGEVPDTIIDQQFDARIEENVAGAYLGYSVAGAGDVNGDGYDDVIVGAPFYDNGNFYEGAAFIYFGGAGAFDVSADAVLESHQTYAKLGSSVSGAGDVNGDGYADVIVIFTYLANGGTEKGAAAVYFGSAGAFDTTADAVLKSDQIGGGIGRVAGAGDVNGDGYDDVIVGLPEDDSGEERGGAAMIYLGGSGPFDTTADALITCNRFHANFGRSVAGAGDVNGDGYADVIIGTPNYHNGERYEVASFIYFGGPGAFDITADALLDTNQNVIYRGVSVSGAGDVNGDGYDDVIMGADHFSNGETYEGAAFIFFGGAGAFDTVADARLEANQLSAYMGNSVSGAGDVNGDGYADVIVGAPGFDNQQTDGAAFVYLGGPGTFNTTADARLDSSQYGSGMALSVAGVGDVNGDGYADVVVGAPAYDSGQEMEGAAFVYLGGIYFSDSIFESDFDWCLANQFNAVLGGELKFCK